MLPSCSARISIHALLAESDWFAVKRLEYRQISIHALLAESDLQSLGCFQSCSRFLSTLSLRRATSHFGQGKQQYQDFYPRSPCGERRQRAFMTICLTNFYPRSPCGERLEQTEEQFEIIKISIHALLAESDDKQRNTTDTLLIFLSTLSLRRATQRQIEFERYSDISIHALLAESDHQPQKRHLPAGYFYPRSPCGERPDDQTTTNNGTTFLSTLSLRRATHNAGPLPTVCTDFYPRSPCGERRYKASLSRNLRYFYPRSPCGERR